MNETRYYYKTLDSELNETFDMKHLPERETRNFLASFVMRKTPCLNGGLSNILKGWAESE